PGSRRPCRPPVRAGSQRGRAAVDSWVAWATVTTRRSRAMPGAEGIWVVIAIVVLFGASRLPAMGRNVGLGIKEFKKGVTEGSKSEDKDEPGRPASADERERGTTP